MEVIYDGQKHQISDGANGFVTLKELGVENRSKAIAMKENGTLKDLASKVEDGATLEFVFPDSPEGFEILNHSCSHLLAEAIHHLYPKALFGFGPAIEEGFYYDIDFGEDAITDADFPKIEEEMRRLSKLDEKIVRHEASPEEALEVFKDNHYKVELIKEHADKGEAISYYSQGDFADLCRGPHVPSTGHLKHFKLLNLAGAYWRGDSKNKQLTRIYGTCFESKEKLEEHLAILEKRKESDHRKLGRQLGLFMISDYGPGFPFFLPKGMLLKNALLDYWHEVHRRYGYQEIETPTMLSKELWLTSGHWDHYKENMYVTKIDDKEFAIKPMNCPGAMLVYNATSHSYRDLPLRLAELGHVHRHEASGALNGLFRVRAFTQDDSHIFISEDMIEDEVRNIMALFDEVYAVFGLDYKIVLSTRPEKDFIGTVEFWDKAEAALAKACRDSGRDFTINPGDGAFYGPKLDFKLKDCMGRTWQCGTIQLDLNLPHRFGCYYVAENGERKEPVMLHRVVFGSIERFIGIITENYGGAFPTWLAPIQARILPVNPSIHDDYAKAVQKEMEAIGYRIELDDSNEKLGYRLRNTQIEKIPYAIVVGDKEKEEGALTYRVYGTKEQITLKKDEFLKLFKEHIDKKMRF